MHTMLFVDWALEARNAQVVGHDEIYDRLMERKKTEPNEHRSDEKGPSDDNSRFALLLGAKKRGIFDANWCGSIFKNVLPTDGREHFFKKI